MRPLLPPLLVAALTCSVPLSAQMATPPPATSPSVTTAIAEVQRFYNQSSTFESDFDQKFWVKAYDRCMTSHGHVTFAKPGKMDWQYAEPSGNLCWRERHPSRGEGAGHAARRIYRWCRPPTLGSATTFPSSLGSTARAIGASPSRLMCGRSSL